MPSAKRACVQWCLNLITKKKPYTSVQAQSFGVLALVGVNYESSKLRALLLHQKHQKATRNKSKMAVKVPKRTLNIDANNIFYWHRLICSFVGQNIHRPDFRWNFHTILVVAISVAYPLLYIITAIYFDGDISDEAKAMSMTAFKVRGFPTNYCPKFAMHLSFLLF